MAKTSIELKEQAKKLLDEARRIENLEYTKVGKIVLDFYNKNKVSGELKTALDEFYKKGDKKNTN